MDSVILIVGAGPVGLMAAHELSRRGAKVRIVDAGDGPTPLNESRALAVHARTLDLLEQSGLDGPLIAKGNKVKGVEIRFDGKVMGCISLSAAKIERDYILSVRQGETERLLIEALKKAGIHVEWKTSCDGLGEPNEPIVALKRPDGTVEEVRPSYVIGADGARSVVREAIGATFEGESEPEEFGLADAVFAEPLDPSLAVFNRLPHGPLGRIPINDRLVRYVSNRPDIDKILPDDPAYTEIVWQSNFRISYCHVDTFQKGRVFLMGDAAHIHSPAGGRGMNLGMEDAAWFAHAYEKGLLDGYTEARIPHVKATLKFSQQQTAQATFEGPIVMSILKVLLPLVLRLGFVQRMAARAILFEDQPRPDWG